MYIKQSHLWANIYMYIHVYVGFWDEQIANYVKLILRNILINVYDIAVKINFIFEKNGQGNICL